MRKISKIAAKKLVKNHNRRVREANKRFDALPPAEKRVAIARDVLAQLSSKKLVASRGTWLIGSGGGALYDVKDIKKNAELQSILAKQEQCQGCALGGMFMCAVRQADKLKLDELNNVKEFNFNLELTSYPEDVELDEYDQIEMDDAFKYLKRFFPKAQLEMIETAFEQGGGACHSDDEATKNFAYDVQDANDRMRLIMENIVLHKGKFVPSVQPVEVTSWTTPGFTG
jgi:hypothetical protein